MITKQAIKEAEKELRLRLRLAVQRQVKWTERNGYRNRFFQADIDRIKKLLGE